MGRKRDAMQGPAADGESSGSVSVVAAMPTETESSEGCSICMGPFETPIRLVDCGHVFCKACICDWVHSSLESQNSSECPLCRTTVKDPAIQERKQKGGHYNPAGEYVFAEYVAGMYSYD